MLETFRGMRHKYELARARGNKQTEMLLEESEKKIANLTRELEKLTKDRDGLIQVRDALLADKNQLQTEAVPMLQEETLIWRGRLYQTRQVLQLAVLMNWYKLVAMHEKDRTIAWQQTFIAELEVLKVKYAEEQRICQELRAELEIKEEKLEQMAALEAERDEMAKELKTLRRHNKELKVTLESRVTKPVLPARFLCMRCSNEVSQRSSTDHEGSSSRTTSLVRETPSTSLVHSASFNKVSTGQLVAPDPLFVPGSGILPTGGSKASRAAQLTEAPNADTARDLLRGTNFLPRVVLQPGTSARTTRKRTDKDDFDRIFFKDPAG
ncbi:unnamed protein product [Amoebophrya sp. A25]|nr:unnamed protein product [Amoebophrya sp. A25]|eukprot:GSA25T00026285001.1